MFDEEWIKLEGDFVPMSCGGKHKIARFWVYLFLVILEDVPKKTALDKGTRSSIVPALRGGPMWRPPPGLRWLGGSS